jgi:predicted transcriptional regulator
LLLKKDNAMSQPHIAAKTVSVKLDAETRSRLENLAETRNRSAHWVMREAISQYVDREEKREAFRQDTIKAWTDYQETGLHASAVEVDTWLSSWGTDNELPVPVCHP